MADTAAEPRPIRLHGTPCAACGQPAAAYHPTLGLTAHLAPGLPNCPTRLPQPTPKEDRP